MELGGSDSGLFFGDYRRRLGVYDVPHGEVSAPHGGFVRLAFFRGDLFDDTVEFLDYLGHFFFGFDVAAEGLGPLKC